MNLFLDANIIFSAAHREQGRSQDLVALARAGHCKLITSTHALAEAQRNLALKSDRFERRLAEALAQITVVVEAPSALVEWAQDLGLPFKDAPSLAAAYVSVSMGARGSDAALEQSDVVLMKDKIEKLLTARELSLKARAIIKQNLFISLGAITVMAVSAIFGLVPLTIGVITHEGSTVVVCLNSLRLLFGRE